MMDPRQVEAARELLFWGLPITAMVFVVKLVHFAWRTW